MTEIDPLVEFVIEEPVERVERFAAALATGRVTVGSTRKRLEFEFVHGPRSLDRMAAVLRSWEADGGDRTLLARSLLAQLAIRRHVEDRSPRCELVWTGETPAGAGVRSTLPVIREMLTTARRSILVVTYSLWIGGSHAASVIDRIAELSSEGIDVSFVLDLRYREGWNVAELKRRWPAGRCRPSLYAWQDEEDEVAKLHAKVLLVDGHDLLITSANLTGHGVKHNLEFGVRVGGQPAADAAAHLEGLIRDDVFRVVEW